MTLQRRVIHNARRRGVVVLTRRQWGSEYKALYFQRMLTRPVTRRQADTLWQHITVTRDDGTLPGEFKADMREVERIGIERFGVGFPYNWGWDLKTGMIGVGAQLLAKGAHTINDKRVPGYSYDQNAVARAIAAIGMPGDKPSEKAVEALAQLFAAMMDEGALTQNPDYEPHRLVAAKDCPTDAVVAVMAKVERRAHQVKRRR